MSNTPYRYNYTSAPNKEKHLGELKDTSVNIASAFSSSSRYNSPSRHFTKTRSLHNSPKAADCLDIHSINHEAVRNDMDLKSISKKPSAFNNLLDDNSLDEGYEAFDAYDELELMVNHPELEEAMRKLTQERAELQYLQGQLLEEQKRQRNHNEPIQSAARLLQTQEESLPLQTNGRLELNSVKDYVYYYFSKWVELIIFQFFMVYWIVKEPIIRTVTFFTMIVSALVVTPALFMFTKFFDQWTPNHDRRRHITYVCTGLLILWSLYSFYPNIQSYIPTDSWKPTSAHIGDFSAFKRHLSKWEERVNQLSDKQLSHEALFNGLSIKINSEIQHIKDQMDHSTTKILQRASHQQDDIEAITKQFDALIQKITDIEEDLLSVESGFKEQLSFPEQQEAIKRYVADEVKEAAPQEVLKGYVMDELKRLTVQETADFALQSRGAHVIHWMTSGTFQPVQPWLQALRYSIGRASRIPTTPEMALQPHIHVGECWSMDGTSGTLGILLSERIFVEGITIEYPTPEVMSYNLSTAPKNIQVLGLKDYGRHSDLTTSLGLVQYDIHKNQSAQHFELESRGDTFEAILIKVLSNWGNLLHTDLYRVRIHGIPV